jgi:hypothetical protein
MSTFSTGDNVRIKIGSPYYKQGARGWINELSGIYAEVAILETDDVTEEGFKTGKMEFWVVLSDLELMTEPSFTVEDVTVRYSNTNGKDLTLTLYTDGMISIESDGFSFANQSELDAILADFKRRAQV